MTKTYLQYERIVQVLLEDAFQIFWSNNWERSAGLPTKLKLENSNPNAVVGSRRKLKLINLVEEIQDVQAPKLIRYKVISGKIPMKKHEALVTFESISDKSTKMTYKVEFEGYLGVTSIMKVFTHISIKGSADKFAKICKKQTSSKSN
eukprot:maker-scaffold_3-snap-gene-18.46-mRNA-1 protein AED:0.03 eAED:0.03 QI:94/1/1/1/1/1/3/22/147